jgi:hypothetical protein
MALITVQCKADPRVLAKLDSIDASVTLIHMHVARCEDLLERLVDVGERIVTLLEPPLDEEQIPASASFTTGTPQEE